MLFLKKFSHQLKKLITYFGKIFMVGTWHFMWNTLGQRSQHSKSPPLIQTAHQSSFGSSSFPSRFPAPAGASLPLGSSPLFKFPLVSGAAGMPLLFSVDDEVVEVIVVVEEDGTAVLGSLRPEQGVSDWGSVLMRSLRVLRASWPADTAPNTGWGLFSGLLICRGRENMQQTVLT